jgi:hypothetical protein
MRLRNRFASAFLMSSLVFSAACGGGGGDDDDDDDQMVDPTGTHHQYVADSIKVPASSSEATTYALNIAGSDMPDNALGGLLSALATTADLDVSGTVNEAVESGQVILLVDVQATALDAASGVGTTVYLGTNPDPAACTDPEDLATCGQHLMGDATFDIDEDSPDNALVIGSIVGGTFNGGPGSVTLQIPLSEGAAPISLDLIGARMQVGVTEDGLTSGKLGGAITMEDINTKVIPAVSDVVADLIAEDCTGAFPDCCEDTESTGATTLDFFNDPDSEDCEVTEAELRDNSIIKSTLLNPDLDLLDGDGNYNPDDEGTKDSLSLGVGFTGVAATFTAP